MYKTGFRLNKKQPGTGLPQPGQMLWVFIRGKRRKRNTHVHLPPLRQAALFDNTQNGRKHISTKLVRQVKARGTPEYNDEAEAHPANASFNFVDIGAPTAIRMGILLILSALEEVK